MENNERHKQEVSASTIEVLITQAAAKQDLRDREQLIQQMAQYPEEAVQVAINELGRRTFAERWQIRQNIAIRHLSAIGCPRNAAAIPALIAHVGYVSHPSWDELLTALRPIPAQALAPSLLAALFDQV